MPKITKSSPRAMLTAWMRTREIRSPVQDYLTALAITGICTVAAIPFYPRFTATNIVMLYMLGITLAALRLGRGPAAVASIASVLALDYFFIPPLQSLDIADGSDLFTLCVMLVVSLAMSHLVVTANVRKRRTDILYDMSRELANAVDRRSVSDTAARNIGSLFRGTAAIFLHDDEGNLSRSSMSPACDDVTLARSVFEQLRVDSTAASGARLIHDTIYLPLREGRVPLRENGVSLREGEAPLHAGGRPAGLLVVSPYVRPDQWSAEEFALLDALATQLGISLQRVRLAERAETARNAAEMATLRNTMLASISHDLRAPLCAIAGAASLIAQTDYRLSANRRSALGDLIERKAHDMSQLLSNVLGLTRLQSDGITLRRDWHTVDDIFGVALSANDVRLSRRQLQVSLPDEPLMVFVEEHLIVQLLTNLLDNAIKHTPAGTRISLSAREQGDAVLIEVADDGPGIPSVDRERVFEAYQRSAADKTAGSGLGLAICRAAARLHGGDISVAENSGGGSRFEVRLPVPVREALRELVPLAG